VFLGVLVLCGVVVVGGGCVLCGVVMAGGGCVLCGVVMVGGGCVLCGVVMVGGGCVLPWLVWLDLVGGLVLALCVPCCVGWLPPPKHCSDTTIWIVHM
jgi:hypothetical protein